MNLIIMMKSLCKLKKNKKFNSIKFFLKKTKNKNKFKKLNKRK